jgi:Ni,Fe-hydrogenase III large subunit
MIGLGPLLTAAARDETLRPIPWRVLDAAGWRALARAGEGAFDLFALWIDGRFVRAIIRYGDELIPLTAPLEGQRLLSLQAVTPLAEGFEKAAAELWGVEIVGGRAGPFLDPARAFAPHAPLAPRLHPLPAPPPEETPPEPGEAWEIGAEGDLLWGPPPYGAEAWRFVLRRGRVAALRHFPGLLHRGLLARLIGRRPDEALSLIGRIAPLSAFAHRLAFLRAIEAACEAPPPPRALAWRLVFAEFERAASLFTSLACLFGKAGAPRSARRAANAAETLRRAMAETGAGRFFDAVPALGGVAGEPEPAPLARLVEVTRALDAARLALAPPAILRGLGRLGAGDFRRAGGFLAAARAAGLAEDARLAPGYPPYQPGAFLPITREAGDAAARAEAALEEIGLALALIRATLADLPTGALRREAGRGTGAGIGWAEGPAGLILCAVRLEEGRIVACFPADPAWRMEALWPALFASARPEELPLLRASLLAEPAAIAL